MRPGVVHKLFNVYAKAFGYVIRGRARKAKFKSRRPDAPATSSLHSAPSSSGKESSVSAPPLLHPHALSTITNIR